MKKFLVAVVSICALLAAGCGRKPSYGSYNIGVCSVEQFIESNVVVSADSFSIVAVAEGPDDVNKYDKPLVFKFVSAANGQRKYEVEINGHTDTVLVTVEKGVLQGLFEVNGEVVAKLHGHLGSLQNLGPDGIAESKLCGEN